MHLVWVVWEGTHRRRALGSAVRAGLLVFDEAVGWRWRLGRRRRRRERGSRVWLL